MKKNDFPGITLSYDKELLLKAALLKGDGAITAWTQWKTKVDIDHVNYHDRQLLPLVYHNLVAQNVADPLLKKLKGIYRYNWVKNQLTFSTIHKLLKTFHNQNIEIWLLKGSALALFYYQDLGLRAMADFDILVPREKALQAINLLAQQEWEACGKNYFKSLNEKYLSVQHSKNFKKQVNHQRVDIDLHWYALSEYGPQNDDSFFKDRSVCVKFYDLNIKTLNPTDHLFYICVHGFLNNSVEVVRWIADALVIINTMPDKINWSFLVHQARKDRLVLPLRDTFWYLYDKFNAPIPINILYQLKATPVKKVEYAEYYWRTSLKPTHFITVLMNAWYLHARRTGFANLPKRLLTFPKFLQLLCRLRGLWELPFYVVYVISYRVKNKILGLYLSLFRKISML